MASFTPYNKDMTTMTCSIVAQQTAYLLCRGGGGSGAVLHPEHVNTAAFETFFHRESKEESLAVVAVMYTLGQVRNKNLDSAYLIGWSREGLPMQHLYI